MTLKLLKNSYWYLIIIFLAFSIMFFLSSYFTIDYQKIISEFTFYHLLLLFITFIIVTFHSIGLNNLIYEKDVIKKPNFVLAFIFLILNTPFTFVSILQDEGKSEFTDIQSSTLNIEPKMVVFSFALLFFLNYLLKLYKQKKPFSIVFNSSIILSILSIFFSHVLLLFPLIFISAIIFRNIDWRCLIISIIALIVPYFFLWTYQSLYNIEFYFPNFHFSYSLVSFSFMDLNLYQKIWFYILTLVIILSISELFRWIYKKSIRSRDSFSIIVFYLIISITVFLFSNNLDSVYLILTPLSIIIANFFVYSKQTIITEIIFTLFLFSSIFYRVSMINM